MAITSDFMEQMKKIPGAVDVGLSEQEPKDELRIELDRGLANQLGISVGDAAQALRVAFAGVEVGDWVDPIGESRDVAVRLHPEIGIPLALHRRDPILDRHAIHAVLQGDPPRQLELHERCRDRPQAPPRDAARARRPSALRRAGARASFGVWPELTLLEHGGMQVEQLQHVAAHVTGTAPRRINAFVPAERRS